MRYQKNMMLPSTLNILIYKANTNADLLELKKKSAFLMIFFESEDTKTKSRNMSTMELNEINMNITRTVKSS